MNHQTGSKIVTASGRELNPLAPVIEDIHILDIAHALSHVCRFTGHCKHFYSVAQHAVLVAMACPEDCRKWGLLHDASEAYLADLAKPVKDQCPGYEAAEEHLLKLIGKKFGLPWPIPREVKAADQTMFLTEWRDLMPAEVESRSLIGRMFDGELLQALPDRIVPWPPHLARKLFLGAFTDLFNPVIEVPNRIVTP